jgi:hypothetical protein
MDYPTDQAGANSTDAYRRQREIYAAVEEVSGWEAEHACPTKVKEKQRYIPALQKSEQENGRTKSENSTVRIFSTNISAGNSLTGMGLEGVIAGRRAPYWKRKVPSK